MKTFSSILQTRVSEASSLLCVGLDPHLSDIQGDNAESAFQFCRNLVARTAAHAAAFKPNAAFFEAFGAPGWDALQRTIATIREESERLGSYIPVILDAKRGDIASTAQAYAHAAFKTLGADAITLSPYMGRDSIEPFTQDAERGVFVLCKTSNPGSENLQNLEVQTSDGKKTPLFLHVAHLACEWNSNDNVGLVVGATYPETFTQVRREAPRQWILVPGVGAQGGDAAAALRAGLRSDGHGMLVSVSRGISRAKDPGAAAAEFQQEFARIWEDCRAAK